MTTLHSFMSTYTPLIEQELERIIPAEWEVPDKLRESIAYSLMSGGKRLRPLMTLAAALAVGGDVMAVMPAACAVELVHTYSLIHDDLPAMDDDDYRRGKLTNHKVFGEAMAILAGDGLLTHAFYAASRLRERGVPAEVVLAIIEDLSLYAGVSGMVGGQAADMLGEQGETTLDGLMYIHQHKTSDLLVCSLKAGGRAAGADPGQLVALERYGRAIGLAFQIQDDILDVIGDEQKLGKRTNADEKQAKVTYPYFVGLEASRAKVKELTEEGKAALLAGHLPDPGILLELADYLLDRDH
jgi:geranylgeranyl diphosphate synthase type II